jgi:hypothetical protein
MKKSNLELILDFLRDFLDYLHNHKWQGRIIAFGVSFSMIIWSINFCVEPLLKFLELLK